MYLFLIINSVDKNDYRKSKPYYIYIRLLINQSNVILRATFHLTISMRGQCATGKIQRND